MATSFLLRITLFVFIVHEFFYRRYIASSLESCQFNHLPCDDKSCIPRGSWCDGQFDCVDGSDESYCLSKDPFNDQLTNIDIVCNKSLHFQCETGECIPLVARCDDLPDCTEKEDEENCDYYFEWNEDSERRKLTTTTAPLDTTVAVTRTSSSKPDTKLYPTLGLHSVPTNGDSLKNALKYVLSQRDSHWGWRNSTAKMIVAIHLANQSFFIPENYDGQMSKKQLEVQVAINLMRKDEIPIRLADLSHFIHALLVTCENPRDFHGINLIKLLKKLINRRRQRKQFVSPLAYLTLCNSGEVTVTHIRRLKNMAYRRNEEPRWLDIQAYALLAISCYIKTNFNATEWNLLRKDVAKNLTDWQQADGSFGTIYSTGLVLQALISANEQTTDSARKKAMLFLKLKQDWEGNFGSDLNNFYVLPALNMKSLADIRNPHCKIPPQSILNTEPSTGNQKKRKMRRKKGKMNIHYSLWIGGEKNEIHTITLSLPPQSNFMEIMEAAERTNPKYKYEIWKSSKGPVVQSIAGHSADIENGLYWTLYRKIPLPFRPTLTNTTATISRLKLFGATKYFKDIRKLYPKNGEHLAFWLKPYL